MNKNDNNHGHGNFGYTYINSDVTFASTLLSTEKENKKKCFKNAGKCQEY